MAACHTAHRPPLQPTRHLARKTKLTILRRLVRRTFARHSGARRYLLSANLGHLCALLQLVSIAYRLSVFRRITGKASVNCIHHPHTVRPDE